MIININGLRINSQHIISYRKHHSNLDYTWRLVVRTPDCDGGSGFKLGKLGESEASIDEVLSTIDNAFISDLTYLEIMAT